MKVVSRKELKSGKRRVVVDLDDNETLMTVNEDAYYKVGYPVEDVFQGHILTNADQVMWCPLEQRWSK